MTNEIKSKKSIWKKWWFWLIIIFIIISITSKNKEEISVVSNTVSKKTIISTSTSDKINSSVATQTPLKIETEIITEPIKTNIENKEIKSTITLFTVTKITDGDTFKADINGAVETIRLIGINTPETVDPRKSVECFGLEASNKAKELLTGKKVKLEADPTQGERDKYNRLLRYAWLEDGTFYNKKMILDGFASEYTYNIPYKYQIEFKQAETEAKNAKRGLWADNICAQSNNQTVATSTGQSFYTSSHYKTKYYYPVSCPDWQSLSSKYLKKFDSLEALLLAYPSRTLSPQCQ